MQTLPPLWKRLGWLLLIWASSVAALAFVAALIKWSLSG
jgi:hypothetical protein